MDPMQHARQILILAAVFLGLLALVLISRRSGIVPAAGLNGVALPALGSGGTVALDSCPTERCLIAYVAPWCGVCRASTALLRELKPYLRERGVETRIVVGQGKPDQIEQYAAEFGPGTLIDLSERVPIHGGVPQFILSDKTGQVLARQPGLPRIIRPPITAADLKEVADFLNLP